MQLGHDDFGGADAFFGVNAGRNAAAVVAHGAGAVGIEHHIDAVGMAGEGLVHGIVYDFINHVVQARAVIGVADIHAGALAHGIQALEHLDAVGVIDIHIGFRHSTHHDQTFGTCGWKIPSRTSKISAFAAANSDRSVPVIQAWAARLSISSNRAARRTASRWAAISSSSRMAASPSRARDSSRASASMMEIKSAFCSPVEQSRASARFGVWRT